MGCARMDGLLQKGPTKCLLVALRYTIPNIVTP